MPSADSKAMSKETTAPTPKRLLRDQHGTEMLMTCIATYPLSEAASAASDKVGFLKAGRSVHVLKHGNELHLYRATKDIVSSKDKHRAEVRI